MRKIVIAGALFAMALPCLGHPATDPFVGTWKLNQAVSTTVPKGQQGKVLVNSARPNGIFDRAHQTSVRRDGHSEIRVREAASVGLGFSSKP